ncbi:MAG: alpha-amylase family glycosyl hydrolase, partial [Candidatus Eremiobacterota bacterium]
MRRTWWKEAVVYQVYPRSFQDSNGDGIGDLKGIQRRLDYLQTLGVDVLWLCPIYPSPNVDNGYDVSDYTDVHPEFGSLADFDELLARAHDRGLKVVLDLVVNHTSDQHPWFRQARTSRDNPYRDYYLWSEQPNDWPSIFGGSAWEPNPATGDYYLHLFAPQQPDLNWENPHVRREVYDFMRFWLDRGVNGFRLDVITFLSKKPGYPPLEGPLNEFYANGPRIHDYLQEMHREVLSRYDAMTVGEAPGVPPYLAPLYVGEDRGELSMIFHFDHT